MDVAGGWMLFIHPNRTSGAKTLGSSKKDEEVADLKGRHSERDRQEAERRADKAEQLLRDALSQMGRSRSRHHHHESSRRGRSTSRKDSFAKLRTRLPRIPVPYQPEGQVNLSGCEALLLGFLREGSRSFPKLP